MNKLLFSLVIQIISLPGSAQLDIKQILETGNNYNKVCKNADEYFKTKYPEKTFKDLAIGQHRDGQFVKYMRWKNFWKEHLNPNGTLGEISIYRKKHSSSNSKSNPNPYDDVQWTNISNSNYITGQISLGRTTSLAFHPSNANTFFVGAAIGGIWKTTDGGQNYTPLGDALPYLAVSAIIVDELMPDNIYISVSDHVWYGPSGIGVFKSIDGGNTWNPTPLSFNFADNIRIYWMAAGPNDPLKMFVATNDGLYETTDGFITFSKNNNLDCSEIHFKPGNSSVIYLGTRNGEFYKSTDGGLNFNLIQDFGNSYVRIAVTAQNDNLVFISHADNLYKSANSGTSFPTNEVLPESNMVISFSPSNSNELLAGNFEIYKSTNQGSSFNAITHWLGNGGLPLIHVDQRNIFSNNLQNDLVYFCNDGGVYSYDVNGTNFNDLSDGLQITQYYDIATSQSNSMVISGGSQDNGSMYRNAAGVWDDLAATGDGMMTEIDPTNENIIYWEYQNGGMRRFNGSTNKNISPPGQNSNGAWETPYRLDPSNSNRLICAYDTVYQSLDKGDSWTSISGDLAGGSVINHVAISKTNGNRIYVIQGSTIYVKDIGSNNWTAKATPTGSITDLEVDPLDMNKIVITRSGYAAGNKVFESTDAGDSWTNISGSLPNVPIGAIEIYEDVTDAYFIGTDQGVYYKDYQLQDWVLFGDLPHSRVEDIEIQYSDKLLRIGTHGRGVFEADIDIIECNGGDPDSDGDGICDLYDLCPFLDDNLIGMACDDGDPLSTGESYTVDCLCSNGVSNISYCAAAGSAGTGSDFISNVQLNTLNNSSGQTAYSDFRSLSTPLFDDSTYTLILTLNHAFTPDEAYAWIDYNRNGIFESNEEIIMSSFSAQHVSEGTFTIPNLSAFGATTLRVRNIYDQPGNNDPCNNYFGEVEDYTIALKDSCPIDTTISKMVYCDPDPLQVLSENTLILDSIILHPDTQLDFEAGQSIELNNGFDVKTGADVDVKIGGCDN